MAREAVLSRPYGFAFGVTGRDGGATRLQRLQKATGSSETRATERYSMSVVSWAPVLLQEAVPSIECGSHSQVFFSVYHERGGDGAGTSHPTAGPGDASRACPRTSNRSRLQRSRQEWRGGKAAAPEKGAAWAP